MLKLCRVLAVFKLYGPGFCRPYLTTSSSYCSYSRSLLTFKQLGNVLQQCFQNFQFSVLACGYFKNCIVYLITNSISKALRYLQYPQNTLKKASSRRLVTISQLNVLVSLTVGLLSCVRLCKLQYVNTQGTPKIENTSQNGHDT